LPWRGPESWQSFLEQQREHKRRRHSRIEQLLCEIGSAARERGLPLVALKGVALHAHGIYEPGGRPMSDIDLLARHEDMDRAAELIQSLGYREIEPNWKHRAFEPREIPFVHGFAEHAGNPIKIELHGKIAEQLPVTPAVITAYVMPGVLVPGLNDYRSRAALFAHVLVHAASSMMLRSLRLLHLSDIARLCARMTDADWRELFHLMHETRAHWVLPILEMTARYFRCVPDSVLREARLLCPPFLSAITRRQTLTWVSLSSLKRQVCPGIFWSQSLFEAATYLKERMLVGVQLAGERPTVSVTEAGGQQPGITRFAKGRRLMKWVLSRPGRPGPLHAIQEARGRVL
jgi:hypothetical protein